MNKRIRMWLLLALLVFAFAVPAQAAKPKLNKKKVTIMVGKSVKLKVIGAKSAKWSSSNKQVAKVGKKGKVTGVKAGKATITAKVGSKKLKCKVTVKRNTASYTPSTKPSTPSSPAPAATGRPVTSVLIASSNQNLELGAGETERITASVTPSNADNKTLTWTSSNPNVASVSQDGIVKGVSLGTATITATAASGAYATSTVKVHDVPIQTPAMPMTIKYYGYKNTLYSSCQIEKVEFTKNYFKYKNEFSVQMWLYGTKTYDHEPNVSSACKVGYKLYDMEGYVVSSGTFYSDSVFPGEKFKGYCYLGTDMKEGRYRLELINVS